MKIQFLTAGEGSCKYRNREDQYLYLKHVTFLLNNVCVYNYRYYNSAAFIMVNPHPPYKEGSSSLQPGWKMSDSGSFESISSHSRDFHYFNSKAQRVAYFYWNEPFSTPYSHTNVADTVSFAPSPSISILPIPQQDSLSGHMPAQIRVHFPTLLQ